MVDPSTDSLTVLLIEDEPDVSNLVRYHLKKAGFRVAEAGDGLSGLKFAREHRPDAVILDLMLPEMPGEEVCKLLKKDKATAGIPVIMLTAKADETQRVAGLELGADDYITKPFSPRELVLRVKAVVRRISSAQSVMSEISEGPFVLDRFRQEVLLDGERVFLSPLEYKTLAMLIERAGRCVSRDTMLKDVWGYAGGISSRTLDTHIRRLRIKLGKHSDAIETIRGEGYRLCVTPSGGS